MNYSKMCYVSCIEQVVWIIWHIYLGRIEEPAKIVASNINVELPDILFDSMDDDPNLILDGQNQHHPIVAYFVIR